MALGRLPNATLRLRPLMFDARRRSGSLCQLCPKATETSADTRSANVDAENLSETKLLSVMNLLTLLENLPPGDKGGNLVDRLKKARKSFEKDDQVLCSGLCSSDRQILNGDDLDKVFGITTQDNVHDFSFSPQPSPDSNLKSHPEDILNFSSVQRHGSVYSLLEDDALRHSFKNYVDSSWQAPSAVVICEGNRAETSKKPSAGNNKRPNSDELHLIQDYFNEYLPKCLSTKHEYRIYSPNVIFENNFAEKPFVIQGIGPYVREISKYRMYAHFRYANVRMSVLASSSHEDEGVVRVRWRLSGIPQVRAFMFWKFLPWKYSSSKQSEAEWQEGISTFHVEGRTGIITKHQIDRVMVDKDPAENVIKNPVINMSGTV